MGDDPKQWLADPEVAGEREEPGSIPNAALWLYKPIKRGVDTGYRRHDDSAERVASALADLVDILRATPTLSDARRSFMAGVLRENQRRLTA